MGKKLTTEEFIERSIKIHGDKYDYSKVAYIKAKVKVCIICPEHGEFWQTPDKHLIGHECPYCNTKVKPSREEYIKKVNNVHNFKYDYSELIYKNKDTKICVICNEKDEFGFKHGKFYVTAHNHLNGCGCPKCAKKYRYSTEEIIKRFKYIHNDKYDYSKTEYKNTKTKICIICPKHGEFWQAPYHHINGCGCPKCNVSKLEENTAFFLKTNNIAFEQQKHFDWLGLQSLDFYLPDYNIAIECQGEQHFKPVDFAGKGVEWAEKIFKNNIIRDKNKLKLCDTHNIKLNYVNFYDNIEDKLKTILSL